MKAIGYRRVSSRDQIEGSSLATQEAQITAYATLKGMTDLVIISDAGVMGEKPLAERPGGKELLDMLVQGEADTVIITKLDRGFRSTVECLENVDRWNEQGVALHVVDMGGNAVDTTSAAGRFMLTVLVAAAEMEKNRINERCNEGRSAARAQGRRLGEIPFGYRLADHGESLVEDPQEQQVLSVIRELKEQGLSLRGIADHLNGCGYRAKKGGRWTHGQVQSVLKRAA